MRMTLALVLVGSLLGCGADVEVDNDAVLPVEDARQAASVCDPNACPDDNDQWFQNFYSDASMSTQVGYRRCLCGKFYYSGSVTAYYTYDHYEDVCDGSYCY